MHVWRLLKIKILIFSLPHANIQLQVHQLSTKMPDTLIEFIETSLKFLVQDCVASMLSFPGALGKIKIADFAIVQATRGNKKRKQKLVHFRLILFSRAFFSLKIFRSRNFLLF
jgi:hypothetical protein